MFSVYKSVSLVGIAGFGVAGSSYRFMENENFLLKDLDKYMKDDVKLISSFIIFDNFSDKSTIEKSFRKNFNIENIKTELDKLNYRELSTGISLPLEKLGEYEDYCVYGERLYNYFTKREKIIN